MLKRLVALAIVLPLAGCAPLVDEKQKQAVTDALEAVPQPALRALGAEKVRIRAVGATAEDAVGFRTVHLRTGAATPTTLDAWVRGCRAAVAALAPTPVRLYGMAPEQSRGGDPAKPDAAALVPGFREVDDARCLRGFGIRERTGGATTGSLRLGTRGADAAVTDLAVDLDLDDGELVARGFAWRPRGTPLDPTTAPVPAAGPVTPLPAGPRAFRGPGATFRKVFVVPAGQRLTVKAACTKRDAAKSMRFRPQDGNVLAFFPYGRDPADPDAAENVSCEDTLVRTLEPQLRYREQGRLIDEYWFDAYATGFDDEPSTDIRVETAP